MAEPVEVIIAASSSVNCDGGGGSLGHPRVFLQIKDSVGKIDCPYCGRRYVLKQGAKAAAGH